MFKTWVILQALNLTPLTGIYKLLNIAVQLFVMKVKTIEIEHIVRAVRTLLFGMLFCNIVCIHAQILNVWYG